MDCFGNSLGSVVAEVDMDTLGCRRRGIGRCHHMAFVCLVGRAHGECGETGAQGALSQGSSRGSWHDHHACVA